MSKIKPLRSEAMEMAEDMEQTEVSQSLPEILVEKIIAMMPFPFIFKARALSKSWRDKFSPISSSKSGEVESVAVTAFQRQVGQWSSKWKTFCPVVRAWKDLVTYDRAAQDWPRLRSMLSFLQDCPLCSNSSLLIEGPLCYGFPEANAPTDDGEYMVVANILTRSWRLLPPRPNAYATHVLVLKLVVYTSLEMYKVILFCKKGRADHYCAQIYNSKSGAWKSKEFGVSSEFRELAAAYLNGILYMVGITTPQSLLAFNVEEETLEELRFSFDGNESLRSARVNMVICNVNWLMLVAIGPWHLYDDKIEVFRIDLGSLRLMRLPHGPPAFLKLNSLGRTCGHGNCIFFFGMEQHGSRAVAYNVDEHKWSPITVPTHGRPYPMCESSFQPGLSPFMAV